MKNLLFIAMTVLCGFPAIAQTGPNSALDTTSIQTGERAVLTLSFRYRVDEGESELTWPFIGDTLARSMEVLSVTAIDTVIPDARDPYLFEQLCKVEITSFDTGYIPILPLPFIFNGDTLESPAVLLRVTEPAVDMEADFADIKDIEELELSWLDWLRSNLWWITGILLAVLGIALLLRYLRKRDKTVLPEPEVAPEPELLPDVWALGQLELLKQKGLWQQGKVKAYHSELNTILREYLERRFGIHAMEETSSQIIRELDRIGLDQIWRSRLRSSLTLADLVKFAKEKPLGPENEDALNDIVAFVKATTESGNAA